jgi:hypothetical protein
MRIPLQIGGLESTTYAWKVMQIYDNFRAFSTEKA